MKTPVTVARIRHHLTYSWWKYALLLFLSIFGWNLTYTVSEYRPPENRKIEAMLYVSGDADALDAYMESVRQTRMTDMEQMTARATMMGTAYDSMVFNTHVGAGFGDVYWMPIEYFQRYAAASAFVPLEQDEALMAALKASGIDLSAGWASSRKTGETHLYGIPCGDLPGITAFVTSPEDCVIGILSACGNEDNARRFLQLLVEDTMHREAVPEQ